MYHVYVRLNHTQQQNYSNYHHLINYWSTDHFADDKRSEFPAEFPAVQPPVHALWKLYPINTIITIGCSMLESVRRKNEEKRVLVG